MCKSEENNSEKNFSLAGVVIWYKPDMTVSENINSYISKLEKLYIIDNSGYDNSGIYDGLAECSKIEYILNKENAGIAKALNIAAEKAIKDNFKWLFTFDDDSKASVDMIDEMRGFILSTQFNSQIAVIAPFHSNKNYKSPPVDRSYSIINDTMTSGNMLNLDIFKKIGGFREEFFIDYVDKEYCLRIISSGYFIFQINRAILFHNLGELEKRRFIFRDISVTHHSPERLYYRTRNRLAVIRQYFILFPMFCIKDFTGIFTDILKIVIYEEKKLIKIKMIIKGAIDFLRGNLGRLEESKY